MKNYYKKALMMANNARQEIEKINEDFEREKEYIDECFSSGMLTPAGKQAKINEAGEKRKERIETAVLPVEELRREFACDMQEAARLDGGQIDKGTVDLLNSGIEFSAAEWQRMVDANKDNATMLRIIKQKYDERPIKKDGMPAGFFDMSGKRQSAEQRVSFPTTPEQKARAFDSFCEIVSRGAVSGAKLNEFPTQNDYWCSVARDNLTKLGEPLDDNEFSFERYEIPKPTVW